MDKYNAYIEQLRAIGVDITTYSCPHCNTLLETQVNYGDIPWDTYVCCPMCNNHHFKITLPNGGKAIAHC